VKEIVIGLATILLQAQGAPAFLGNPIWMMVIVMGIFYVLLILPQQRRQKQLRAMIAAVKSGDKVITTGGVYGTIAGIDGDTLILRIADQVKIRIARSAIAQVEGNEDAK